MVEEIARFRLEDVPFTLPARREMNGTLTREQQLRRRVEDTLVGLGFAEIYTPSLRPDDDTAVEAPRADLGRADRAADDAPPEPGRGRPAQRRRRRAPDRAVRDRPRLPRRRATFRDERLRVAGDHRGRVPAREGRRRDDLRGAQGRARFRAGGAPAAPSGQDGATTPAGVLGELHPRELEGEWGAFELDLDELFDAAGGPVIYRDVITYPAVRQDIAVAVPEDVAGRRSRRRRQRSGGRGAARDPRLRRLPRRPGRPGPQVGRLLGRLPVGASAR